MSLPIAATGPLKVETKPILMVFCWATDGAETIAARAATAQPASNKRFMTGTPLGEMLMETLARRGLAAQFEALNLTCRGFRQVLPKLDPAWIFVGRELGFDVLLERPRHGVTRG